MGRPRKHADHAARQRAYAAKQRRDLAALKAGVLQASGMYTTKNITDALNTISQIAEEYAAHVYGMEDMDCEPDEAGLSLVKDLPGAMACLRWLAKSVVMTEPTAQKAPTTSVTVPKDRVILGYDLNTDDRKPIYGTQAEKDERKARLAKKLAEGKPSFSAVGNGVSCGHQHSTVFAAIDCTKLHETRKKAGKFRGDWQVVNNLTGMVVDLTLPTDQPLADSNYGKDSDQPCILNAVKSQVTKPSTTKEPTANQCDQCDHKPFASPQALGRHKSAAHAVVKPVTDDGTTCPVCLKSYLRTHVSKDWVTGINYIHAEHVEPGKRKPTEDSYCGGGREGTTPCPKCGETYLGTDWNPKTHTHSYIHSTTVVKAADGSTTVTRGKICQGDPQMPTRAPKHTPTCEGGLTYKDGNLDGFCEEPATITVDGSHYCAAHAPAPVPNKTKAKSQVTKPTVKADRRTRNGKVCPVCGKRFVRKHNGRYLHRDGGAGCAEPGRQVTVHAPDPMNSQGTLCGRKREGLSLGGAVTCGRCIHVAGVKDFKARRKEKIRAFQDEQRAMRLAEEAAETATMAGTPQQNAVTFAMKAIAFSNLPRVERQKLAEERKARLAKEKADREAFQEKLKAHNAAVNEAKLLARKRTA